VWTALSSASGFHLTTRGTPGCSTVRPSGGRFTGTLKKRKMLSRRIVLCGKAGAEDEKPQHHRPPLRHGRRRLACRLFLPWRAHQNAFVNHRRPFIGEGP
jgi:hypothetical protein